jgi:hypothetical protein
MTPEQFCYWLKGYSEVAGTEPNDYQWKVIQDHLETVFNKVTSVYTPKQGLKGQFPQVSIC